MDKRLSISSHLLRPSFFILTLLIFILLPFNAQDIQAAPVYDQANGTWTDDFSTTGGLSYQDKIGVDTSDGKLKLTGSEVGFSAPYNTSGSAKSKTITPPLFSQWGEVTFSATVPENTTLKIKICDEGGNLFLDSDLAGNSSGFTTSPIDLSGLPFEKLRINGAGKIGRIKLLVEMTTSDTSVTPSIDSWSVSWTKTRGDLSASPMASTAWAAKDVNDQHTNHSSYYNQETYPVIRWTRYYENDSGGHIIRGSGEDIYVKTMGGYTGSFYPGTFASINRNTGEVNWEKDFSGSPYSSSYQSLSSNGTIYIHCVYHDILMAYEASTGTLKWSYQFYGSHTSTYVAIGDDGTLFTSRTNDNSYTVYAFDPDGTVKWTYADDPPGRMVEAEIAIGTNGDLYIGHGTYDSGWNSTNEGKLVALDPTDGSVQWSYDTGDCALPPIVDPDGTIYMANTAGTSIEKKIYAINPDGSLKWERSFGTTTDRWWYMALRSDNKLLLQRATYGSSYPKSNYFDLVDTSTGEVITSFHRANHLGRQVITDGVDGYYYTDQQGIDYGMGDNVADSATLYYYTNNTSLEEEKWRVVLDANTGINEYILDEDGRLYFTKYTTESGIGGWNAHLVALFPWTLSVALDSQDAYSSGDTISFEVTTSMQETNPVDGGNNQVQVVIGEDKVPLSYSSTDSNGDTVWTGTYEIPLSLEYGEYSYTVEAAGVGVKTDITTHFASPPENSENTGLTLSGSFEVKDAISPEGSVIIDGGNSYTNSTSVTLTISATDATDPSNTLEMMISNNSNFSGTSWESYSTTKSWSLDEDSDGERTVYIKFKDPQDNESSTYSDSITLDSLAPTGLITINKGKVYTNSRNVRLNINSRDVLSGVSEMMICNRASFNNCHWENYTTSKGWTLRTGNGTKIVYIKFRDQGKNTSQVYSDNIILDTVGPTGFVRINKDGIYTGSREVRLTIRAQDNLAGLARMMICNKPSFRYCHWENYTTSKEWTLQKRDGEKTVYIKFKDVLGNKSQVYSDTIILDTTAPWGLIKINKGKASTSSRRVRLTINGRDVLSGVSKMTICNRSSFKDCSWRTFSASTAMRWRLRGGNGTKTVYLRLKDYARNISTYSDTIVLE